MRGWLVGAVILGAVVLGVAAGRGEGSGGRVVMLASTIGPIDAGIVRALEDTFVADGWGIDRRDVMYNDFVILGPPADPAGIRGEPRAAAALARIAAARAPFVTRGDQSGTHVKEVEIWQKAGVTPAGACSSRRIPIC
jgi:tungstate transport system substrate-binding protein